MVVSLVRTNANRWRSPAASFASNVSLGIAAERIGVLAALTPEKRDGQEDLWSYQGGRVFPDSIGLTIQTLK